MGKTKPTYRALLSQRKDEWQRYRQWLRNHQRPAYDAVWAHAESFSDAAGEANPRRGMDGILFSVCLGQQLEIAELEDRIEELEEETTE